ncbi:class I SAM-dependent methyltransferase [Altericroceibacterium xinjiangense]|uniref:class I SAM-dependent methyltransferase n=1 Tax=Altericroceibacterium xinjiangense TaxID=762261 RepID=UPI000F7E2DF5|nr:class I SAM-dependent methyltransferase [Altericroceibacterium xinjiangense]
MRSIVLAAVFGLALGAGLPGMAAAQTVSGHVLGHAPTDPALAPILADPRRAEDRARDQYRNPAETLAFLQVKPGMTVVDYLPASGWYTRVLAPYLGPQGHYIAMGPDVSNANERMRNYMGGLAEKFPQQAAQWNLGQGARMTAFNVDQMPEGLEGTVDRVLIMREIHNQLRFGWLHDDMMAIRKLLKPDGMVGIVEHRANENAPYAMADGSKGYMREKDVIALMDVYGFDLVGRSEINANPKDTKNWPDGVWMLPPGLRGATDATRAQMQAIGESDRMTLLFRKRA